MDHAITPAVRGVAQFAAALALMVGAGCSGPPDARPTDQSPVRASAGAAETVGVEKADLYRAREVPGVVEQRPERSVRSAWTGTFAEAPGIRKGRTVRKGSLLGTVRTCVAPARSAPEAATNSTSETATGGSLTEPADDAGTTAPGCLPRWHAVRAPVAGTITALADADVTQGATLASLRPPGFVIRATVTDPAALYDLMRPPSTGRTRILGGPAGFTVRYERRTYDPQDGSVVLVLAVPDEITVIEGLRTSTAFVVSRRTAVPTLPVTAVQGTTGVGQVVVVEGGRSVVTSVKLGQHDGARVEVTGLAEGALVLRFPLASDFVHSP